MILQQPLHVGRLQDLLRAFPGKQLEFKAAGQIGSGQGDAGPPDVAEDQRVAALHRGILQIQDQPFFSEGAPFQGQVQGRAHRAGGPIGADEKPAPAASDLTAGADQAELDELRVQGEALQRPAEQAFHMGKALQSLA